MRMKSDGTETFARGPYRFEFRKELLKRLLLAQKAVRENGPDKKMELIQPPELEEIRRLWKRECGDWDDSVPASIVRCSIRTSTGFPETLGDSLLRTPAYCVPSASAMGFPPCSSLRLLDLEREVQGMARRASVYVNLAQVLREEWRDESLVLKDMKGRIKEAAEGR